MQLGLLNYKGRGTYRRANVSLRIYAIVTKRPIPPYICPTTIHCPSS